MAGFGERKIDISDEWPDGLKLLLDYGLLRHQPIVLRAVELQVDSSRVHP